MKAKPKRTAPRPSLSATDRKALENVARTLVRGTKTLRRRAAFGRFQRVNAIIIQDPTNPGSVSICMDIVIPLGNGRFAMWCICFDPQGRGTVNSGPCAGTLV